MTAWPKRDRRKWQNRAGVAAGLVLPTTLCLIFSWAAALGQASGAVCSLLLAVASPVIGAAMRLSIAELWAKKPFPSRISAIANAKAPAYGVLLAAIVMCFGSIETGQLLNLLVSLSLLMGFGWGIGQLAALLRIPMAVAVVVAAGLSVASAGMPFWTDRVVSSAEAADRGELQGTLMSLSTTLTLGAEVFGEQLLQKPWLYLQGKSAMAGGQVHASPDWLGGWRVIAIGVSLLGMGAGALAWRRDRRNEKPQDSTA